jgi:hypothetical protein
MPEEGPAGPILRNAKGGTNNLRCLSYAQKVIVILRRRFGAVAERWGMPDEGSAFAFDLDLRLQPRHKPELKA